MTEAIKAHIWVAPMISLLSRRSVHSVTNCVLFILTNFLPWCSQDYEEDFEEELEASSESEGGDRGTPAREDGEVEGRVDLVEILQAIDAENKMVDLATTHEECAGNNKQYHSEQYLPEQTGEIVMYTDLLCSSL